MMMKMMENSNVSSRLVGSEIHGFHTMDDLDVGVMMEEAKSRWLRPNEIHAILCNHKYFVVNVKPRNLPKSGTVVLFDRKMLRNFRKDGHNWKKKKDGKTVKEAHEHLKVGNEERIHVYYAHGEDNPTFVRRCYWLLDKSLENIVLVHYRETREGSPATSGNSNSSSALSELPGSLPLLEEFDSALDQSFYGGSRPCSEQQDSMSTKNIAQRLHEINTLEWDELLVPDGLQKQILPQGKIAGFEQPNQYEMSSYGICVSAPGVSLSLLNGGDRSSISVYPESTNSVFSEPTDVNDTISYNTANNLSSQIMNSGFVSRDDSSHNLGKDGLQSQDSFGKWMTDIIAEFPGSADDQTLKSSILNENQSLAAPVMDNHPPYALDRIFNITEVSPAWALSTEDTKILVVGFFSEGQIIGKSKLFLACGDSVHPVEIVQAGVFRCLISPQTPGLVNLYMTYDGHKPISQVLAFEFRAPALPSGTDSLEKNFTWEEFQLQMRLAQLLFSSSKILDIFSSKLSQNALKEAKAFAEKTSHISNGWTRLNKIIGSTKVSFPLVKDSLFELILQNRLQEWLLEQVVAGCKKMECDEQGQGVIHLCAILGYTWVVYPYSCSGLSLDYRDKSGWTALHWAAYYGREKMVAALLSAGAKPNLVTDPTSENPGGCTAADLASKNGYDGLAAYLAEKGLVAQFNDMTLAGNVSGSLQTTANDTAINIGDFTEEESYLKDTLSAYRTAADAAARIQASFREHSFKVRSKAIESSNPEIEARNIVAAMRIQHAFRNYEMRKKTAAAARIQYGFRTWKIRKNFLNMRHQAIKIQAVFRGYQVRKQYRKIVWSVGVLEKAVLRWRLKRKGFRGLQVEPSEVLEDPNQQTDAEEDFFQASRKQAEERVERSVVKVQAMFRSRRAQEEYRRMKLEHNQAKLEYKELLHPDIDMGWGKG